jgi:hypothetical protein
MKHRLFCNEILNRYLIVILVFLRIGVQIKARGIYVVVSTRSLIFKDS